MPRAWQDDFSANQSPQQGCAKCFAPAVVGCACESGSPQHPTRYKDPFPAMPKHRFADCEDFEFFENDSAPKAAVLQPDDGRRRSVFGVVDD